MKPFAWLLAAVLLPLPAVARAQPGATAPVDQEDDKSPSAALALSLAGTAGGYGALIAAGNTGSDGLAIAGLAGIVVGPSLGQIYAGEGGRAAWHSLLRVGAGGVMVYGAMLTMVDCWDEEDSGGCDGSAGPILMIGGAVVGIGSTIYSIVDSERAAERHNAEVRHRRLVLVPAPLVGPERSTGYGVQLGASF
jgi:hypothetical protein